MSSQNLCHQDSRQTLEDLIETFELSDSQKLFMRSRWLDQVSWMAKRAKETRDKYYKLRLITIVGGIIVPIMLSVSTGERKISVWNIGSIDIAPILRDLSIAMSGVVAISAAVEEFFHYGDRWLHYRRTAESLKTQGWQFSQLSGLYSDYKTHQEAYPGFTVQVENILQRDVEVYVTVLAQEKNQKQEKVQHDPTGGKTSTVTSSPKVEP